MVVVAVNNGLGKHIYALDPAEAKDLRGFLKVRMAHNTLL
jgi:hypothetical protein